MGKRRTRKEKEKARHTFLYTWNSEPKNKAPRHDVKGQFENSLGEKTSKAREAKNAMNVALSSPLTATKRDIVKSLILASLILALELVVYLAWS